MHWPLRICCAVLITAGIWAQSPQIPETNPFSSEADLQQGVPFQRSRLCHGGMASGRAPTSRPASTPRRPRPDLRIDPFRSSRAKGTRARDR